MSAEDDADVTTTGAKGAPSPQTAAVPHEDTAAVRLHTGTLHRQVLSPLLAAQQDLLAQEALRRILSPAS